MITYFKGNPFQGTYIGMPFFAMPAHVVEQMPPGLRKQFEQKAAASLKHMKAAIAWKTTTKKASTVDLEKQHYRRLLARLKSE